MNKTEFLEQLARELSGLPAEERAAALQYFTMHLDDAGPEREQEALGELGTPAKVAADILAASGQGGSSAEPFVPKAVPPVNSSPWQAAEPAAPNPPQYSVPSPAGSAANTIPQQGVKPKHLLLIILFVLLLPFWGTLFSLFMAAVSVLLVPFIAGVSLLASAAALAACCFVLFPLSVGNGMLILGAALVLLGLGLLLCWFGVWLLAKLVPAMWRGGISLARKILR